MALTIAQLLDAVEKYAGQTDAHSKAAFARNIDLLRSRTATIAQAVKALAEPVALSVDPQIALAQLLVASGVAPVHNEGGSLTYDPLAVLAASTGEAVRELALLGFFGTPGTTEGVDYSLFEQFYDPTTAPQGRLGLRDWAPKDPNSAIWATYLASK